MEQEIMTDSHITERQGALLTVSLLLRKVAKGYESETMKAALLPTNADEAKQLDALGVMEEVSTAAAGLCQGALEGMADMIEGLSNADDATWLKVVTTIRDNLKAEADPIEPPESVTSQRTIPASATLLRDDPTVMKYYFKRGLGREV